MLGPGGRNLILSGTSDPRQAHLIQSPHRICENKGHHQRACMHILLNFFVSNPGVNTTWFEERTCMKCPSSKRQETSCLLMKGFFQTQLPWLFSLIITHQGFIGGGTEITPFVDTKKAAIETSLHWEPLPGEIIHLGQREKNSHKWSRITFLHMLRLYGIFMLWSWIACQRRKHNITVPCGNWDLWCRDDSEILRRRSWRLHWIRSPYAAVDWPVAKKPLLSCGLASMCHPYLHLD